MPWSPLGSGFLTGKYARGTEPSSDTRLGNGNAMFKRIGDKMFTTDRNWATMDAVREIASEIGATPSQVALSCLQTAPPSHRALSVRARWSSSRIISSPATSYWMKQRQRSLMR
ncbi:aldo/keto reductase [Rhizobium leguminosarum]|uniref:aldo/keto reductase n=1 Tax=Rhizobium leguminosarum TaxID=384 RepID=UPI000FF4A1A5|nr:aldo/keto reductase [Rhizobium leguminosarum]